MVAVAAAAKSLQSTGVGCHFLLQCVKVKSLSCVRLLVTPWTAAYQAPPSMGFSRQEYWSGVPLPSPHADTLIPEWYTLSRTLSDHHIRASQGPFLLMSKPYLPLNSAP